MQRQHRNGISSLYWVSPLGNNYSSLWSNLKTRINNFNQTDVITMSDFITNLDPHKKVLLLLGGLSLPFDDASVVLIKRFVASAVGKIHKLWTAKLLEPEAPWLTNAGINLTGYPPPPASLWTGRGGGKGRGKREPVGMAKDFDFQLTLICAMFKLTIWVAITTTAINCE